MISNVVLHSLPAGLPLRPAAPRARRGADLHALPGGEAASS